MRNAWIVSIALGVGAGAAAGAQVPSDGGNYLCVSESSAGFRYDKQTKTWKGTNFRTDDKYLIAPSKSPNYAFQVTRVGESSPAVSCDNGFNEPGYLHCEGIGGEFKFNRRNGRFLFAFVTGYFNVIPSLNDITDETSDTPFIEIGKCSPF
jgi:hypothetical protein